MLPSAHRRPSPSPFASTPPRLLNYASIFPFPLAFWHGNQKKHRGSGSSRTRVLQKRPAPIRPGRLADAANISTTGTVDASMRACVHACECDAMRPTGRPVCACALAVDLLYYTIPLRSDAQLLFFFIETCITQCRRMALASREWQQRPAFAPLAASAMSHVTKLDTPVGTCAAQAERSEGAAGSLCTVQWRWPWRAPVSSSPMHATAVSTDRRQRLWDHVLLPDSSCSAMDA